MAEQTEHEKKVAQEIKRLYSQRIKDHLQEKVKEIRMQMIDRDQGKKILLIKLPEEILEVVHEKYAKLTDRMKVLYPDFYVLTIRDTQVVSILPRKRFYHKIESKNMKKHVQENWIKDLCYPALVEMRKTDVFNGEERIESALVSSNSDHTESDFSAMEHAFKALTGRTIHYNHVFY